MTAQELRDLSTAAPSLKKRTSMKYAESLNVEKFYKLLKEGASLGKDHVFINPYELGEDIYDVMKLGKDEFDRDHLLILLANKIESEIEGIKASPDGGSLLVDWR